MCSSQSRFRFSKARMEVGVIPATYSRSSHTGRLNAFACRLLVFCSGAFFAGLLDAVCLLVTMNFNSFVAESKAMHAGVMGHAAGFQEVQGAHALRLALADITQNYPCVHQGRDADRSFFQDT